VIEFDHPETFGAKIRVVGVGGGGGNAVDSMIAKGFAGVDFLAINTDLQVLEQNLAGTKLQVGRNSTRGLGAGANPEIGAKACEEDRDEIAMALAGSDMVFITAGMGGGTGTGGAPVVASIAKNAGALVVGIVTKPFTWEGKRRHQQAEAGIAELRKHVDTLIVIPNQRLLAIVAANTPLSEAFDIANGVLYHATRGIADLITTPGLVNVDFADVRTIMRDMGEALMGTGIARGESRAVEAAQSAIASPLLEGVSIAGAQGVLVNVTGGETMTLMEISEAAEVIHETAGDDANIIFGAVIDKTLTDELKVTVIATGFGGRTGLSHPAYVARREERRPPNAPGPRPDHVPSGVRELKDFDEPAFQRRLGIDISRISLNEAEFLATGSTRREMDAAASYEMPRGDASRGDASRGDSPRNDPARPAERDTNDRPAFLRKIMD
jgi:cell division protein FtsZ